MKEVESRINLSTVDSHKNNEFRKGNYNLYIWQQYHWKLDFTNSLKLLWFFFLLSTMKKKAISRETETWTVNKVEKFCSWKWLQVENAVILCHVWAKHYFHVFKKKKSDGGSFPVSL